MLHLVCLVHHWLLLFAEVINQELVNLCVALHLKWECVKLLTLSTLKLEKPVLRSPIENFFRPQLDNPVCNSNNIVFFEFWVNWCTLTVELTFTVFKLSLLLRCSSFTYLELLCIRFINFNGKLFFLLLNRLYWLLLSFLSFLLDLVIRPVVSSVFSDLLLVSFVLLNKRDEISCCLGIHLCILVTKSSRRNCVSKDTLYLAS